MSRSYKKFPKIKSYYGRSGKFGKNKANRKIRRLPVDYDIPNGKSFKKLNERFDIWDYSCVQFKEWTIKDWEKEEKLIANDIEFWRAKYHASLKETLVDWKKTYLSK